LLLSQFCAAGAGTAFLVALNDSPNSCAVPTPAELEAESDATTAAASLNAPDAASAAPPSQLEPSFRSMNPAPIVALDTSRRSAIRLRLSPTWVAAAAPGPSSNHPCFSSRDFPG
jgi:hypothetical protein